MRHIDYYCPYCGAPVMLDKKYTGFCEYCGLWLIYDPESDRIVPEDEYKSGYKFKKGRKRNI